MKMKTIATILALVCSTVCLAQERSFTPTATYKFADRDTCQLFLDYYAPASGSETSIDGVRKPLVMFAFGGGFTQGSRDDKYFMPWIKMLSDNGFGVVSIDYRLGLKGSGSAGINAKFIKLLDNAISIAVDDLFSATNYILENPGLFDEPDKIVVSGSSAGAITIMQAEWDICNSHASAKVLPEGFNYAGAMSFAGAIFSKEGGIRYAKEPCPTLMLHGTADQMVQYRQLWFFRLRFAGTDVITRTFEKEGYNYNTLRFDGNGHSISASMVENFPEEMRFLKANVMKGDRRIVDALVSDPAIKEPQWSRSGYKAIYE